jgi:hypothetical protein
MANSESSPNGTTRVVGSEPWEGVREVSGVRGSESVSDEERVFGVEGKVVSGETSATDSVIFAGA